jgi:lipoate-protein ligase A
VGALPADGAVGVGAHGWTVRRRVGPAGAHHGRDLDPAGGRLVELLEAEAPALVLGSTQPESDVDPEAVRATNTAVVRRRSGGGAVLVGPSAGAWVDVTIPRHDALWDDDVARAFGWLGRCWADALGSLGVDGAEAHDGPLVETAWSRRICFAGLGPGEVVVDGRKVVGISQRRTRAGARFQCMVHRRWDPAPLVQLLALRPDERAAAVADLAGAAAGVDVEPGAVLDALVAALP